MVKWFPKLFSLFSVQRKHINPPSFRPIKTTLRVALSHIVAQRKVCVRSRKCNIQVELLVMRARGVARRTFIMNSINNRPKLLSIRNDNAEDGFL